MLISLPDQTKNKKKGRISKKIYPKQGTNMVITVSALFYYFCAYFRKK